MPWKFTLNVPDGRVTTVMNLFASLNLKFEVERVGKAAVTETGKVTNFLSLGPNPPRIGTVSARIVGLFEKLEAEHGAHSVTRAMLTEVIRQHEKLKKFTKGTTNTGITNALNAGYLKLQTD